MVQCICNTHVIGMSLHVIWLFMVASVLLSRVLVDHPYRATALGGTRISPALLLGFNGSCLSGPRVARFIWRSHFYSLSVLLLLSGDIHLNPGPDDQPCLFCFKLVTDDDETVCCDCCNKWIHVSCDLGLSSEEYKNMVDNPSDDFWLCFKCTEHVSQGAMSSQLHTDTHSLSCVCLNGRSIVSKRFDFLAYICAHRFDVVAVTETFLDDSVHDSHITPPGYSVFRRDRNRHGGGVALLVRDCLNAFHRQDLEAECELVWAELPTRDTSVLFGVVYRPPQSPVSYLEELRSSMICAVGCNVPVIICGDFNLPNIDWATVSPSPCSVDASTFCDIVSDCFLTQLVTFTTRNDHVLDLVLTTHPDLIFSISSCDNLPNTDHNAISFSVASVPPRPINHSRLLYNFCSIDSTHLSSVLSSTPWCVIDYTGDIELSWSMWKDLFFSIIDSVIPKVRWKSRKIKHWFSSSTINLIHKKRKLYRLMHQHPTSTNKSQYRNISNLVRIL